MNKIHFHIDETEWQIFTEEKRGALRWKELLNLTQGGSKEFIFGLAELPVGGRLPLHTHQQAETAGQEDTWTPVEDIYTDVRWRK